MGLRSELSDIKTSLPADLLASFVVFLVALPLCMGVAVASGVPPALGLITGIVGGLVVGVLAGSPLQVSGPAAGLTVVVWELVGRFGLQALGPLLLMAGLFQVLAGALRMGRWFRAVPPSIIHGMLAGIGVLIVASQLHVMIDEAPKGSPLQNLIGLPGAAWKVVFPPEGATPHVAAAMGLLTIAVLLLWNRFAPRGLRALPGALMGVVAATSAAAVFGLPLARVAVPDSLAGAANVPSWMAFGVLSSPAAWMAVLALAVIASAETLLCATALDGMHGGPRTKYDKELTAQGIGNAICGLLGALPMTGVIVRSSANVQSGAKTRASAILHGAWLLALVALAPQVLRWIPVASLAAVLVYTGYKLIEPKRVRELRAYGRGEVLIFFATVLGIVATDLLKGILIGIALAMVKLLYRFTHIRIEVRHDHGNQRTTIHLSGSATFLRLPELSHALESVPAAHELIVELEELDYIDHASLALLTSWEKQHLAQGGRASIGWEQLRFLCHNPATTIKEARRLHIVKSNAPPPGSRSLSAQPQETT